MQAIEYGFYRHQPDGELYAIESMADGTVLGVCGPLTDDDAHVAELPNYDYDRHGVDWANSAELIWIPADGARIEAETAEAREYDAR